MLLSLLWLMVNSVKIVRSLCSASFLSWSALLSFAMLPKIDGVKHDA